MSYRWNRGGWRQAQPHCQISADCTCHEPLKKTWQHRRQGEPGMHPDPWQYPSPQVPLPESGGFTMTPMELVDESAIQNVASRNPASLLRTITLPVYQVLVTSIPTPHINKSPYCIGRRPLDESGRWGGRGLGLKGRANDGFDLRYMKNRVNVFKRGG